MVLTTKYQWDQGSERNRSQGILMLYLHEIKTKLSMSKKISHHGYLEFCSYIK